MFDRERLRKLFPNLMREIEEGTASISISSYRSDAAYAEEVTRFSGYVPDVIDFIRRCDTEEQAREIIDFLEKRKEISADYAEKLRRQLKERGLRSFGPKKEEDYYFRRGGYG